MDLIDKTVEEEFSVCDVCGYDRGFHVSFQKKDDRYDVILIYPQCGVRFKVNWEVELG